jgi:hypothetical protein
VLIDVVAVNRRCRQHADEPYREAAFQWLQSSSPIRNAACWCTGGHADRPQANSRGSVRSVPEYAPGARYCIVKPA